MMGAFATAFMIVIPAVAGAIIAGIIFHRLVSMYIMGEAGPLYCFAVVCLYLGMIVCAVTLQIALSVILLLALVFLLLIPLVQSRRCVRTLYNEQIEQFRTAIESDPRNMAARARLAETLYKKGDLDEAIAEMSEVVRLSPASHSEAYRLRSFMRERDERSAPPRQCPSCGHTNPAGRTHCYNCEASMSVNAELVKWLRGGGMREIVISSAITVAIVMLVLVGLHTLSIVGRIIIVGFVLIVGAVTVLVRMYMNS